MIYLVSNTQELFKTDLYERLDPVEALKLLHKEDVLAADTETEGLDFLSKKLLTIQLGNANFQIVWDCTTVDIQLLKPLLEAKLTVWWNAAFDLTFLYKNNIWPRRVIDLMLQEQLLYLGIDSKTLRLRCEDEFGIGYTPFSLKTAAARYCNEHLNKEIRGKIITVGLTPETIEYSARDVAYELQILDKQLELLKEKDLLKAAKLENEFVRAIAYTKFCGIKLDANKWKIKMRKDREHLDENLKALNDWVVKFWEEHKSDKDSEIKLRLRVGKNYKGKYEDISPNLPKGSELISGTTEIEEDEDGERILYNVGLYKIPFGYTMRGKFNPYIYRDMQGDLFSGFNTEPQCIINWSSSAQIIPLFELLGFNLETIDKKTKLPKKSVESKIIESQKHISSIAKPYLSFKKAEKVCTTYGENWLKAIRSDGRIHCDFNQLGTATARLSSGGGETDKLNLQNLPHDAETRSCFVCESGNKFISEDYQSQESKLIASVANDKAMIDLFTDGCGDIHSLVAYMAYRQIPRGTKIEDISQWAKDKLIKDGVDYHQLRFEAKGIEFGINYGGDYNTIANNKGIPLEEAKEIYDNYMRGFPGVRDYQDYCRTAVMQDGYILENPVTKHKAFIEDWEELHSIQKEMEDRDFWEEYREAKKYDLDSDIVRRVRYYYRRKADLEKQSINFRIQNRGAMCFKFSTVYFYNYLLNNNLQNKVLMCAPVHDEWNIEAPESMAEDIAKVLQKCMEKGAKPFCTRLSLSTDISIGDFWIH